MSELRTKALKTLAAAKLFAATRNPINNAQLDYSKRFLKKFQAIWGDGEALKCGSKKDNDYRRAFWLYEDKVYYERGGRDPYLKPDAETEWYLKVMEALFAKETEAERQRREESDSVQLGKNLAYFGLTEEEFIR